MVESEIENSNLVHYPRPQIEIDPAKKIWRYMDLSKFVKMITSGAIWFSRSDLLGDQFEGSLPPKSRGKLEQVELGFSSLFAGISQLDITRLDSIELGNDDADEELIRRRKIREENRRSVFVNSWHANQHESAAMWKLYKSDVGVAIVSTVAKLQEVFSTIEDVVVDKVRYIDFEKENVLSYDDQRFPFLIKRMSFSHEREVRAIYTPNRFSSRYSPEELDAIRVLEGVTFSFPLSKLITEIKIDPDAPYWSLAMIEKLLEKWDLNIPVSRSDLLKDPVF